MGSDTVIAHIYSYILHWTTKLFRIHGQEDSIVEDSQAESLLDFRRNTTDEQKHGCLDKDKSSILFEAKPVMTKQEVEAVYTLWRRWIHVE